MITRRSDNAEGNGTFGYVLLPFFTRSYQNLKVRVAGFFVNTTPERVYYGDASTWDACTIRVIQPMVSRASGQVRIRQEITPFPTGDLWAYVVNRDHLYNATGYKVRSE